MKFWGISINSEAKPYFRRDYIFWQGTRLLGDANFLAIITPFPIHLYLGGVDKCPQANI